MWIQWWNKAPQSIYYFKSQQRKTFKSCSLESKCVVIVLMTFQTGQKVNSSTVNSSPPIKVLMAVYAFKLVQMTLSLLS